MTCHPYSCSVCGTESSCCHDAYVLGLVGGCFETPRIDFCGIDCFLKVVREIHNRVQVIRENGDNPEWADMIEAALKPSTLPEADV